MGAQGYSAKITQAGDQKIRLRLYGRLSRIGKNDIFDLANGKFRNDEFVPQPGF